MTAIDLGWPIKETAAKLPEISEIARRRVQVRDEGYPLITAQDVATAVERNELKRGSGAGENSQFHLFSKIPIFAGRSSHPG
jgi:hypothetical protein